VAQDVPGGVAFVVLAMALQVVVAAVDEVVMARVQRTAVLDADDRRPPAAAAQSQISAVLEAEEASYWRATQLIVAERSADVVEVRSVAAVAAVAVVVVEIGYVATVAVAQIGPVAAVAVAETEIGATADTSDTRAVREDGSWHRNPAALHTQEAS
jgi:hypothetical protein